MRADDLDYGIKREIVAFDENSVQIIETFDLTHPRCPVSVWRYHESPWQKEPDVYAVTRTTIMSRAELSEMTKASDG